MSAMKPAPSRATFVLLIMIVRGIYAQFVDGRNRILHGDGGGSPRARSGDFPDPQFARATSWDRSRAEPVPSAAAPRRFRYPRGSEAAAWRPARRCPGAYLRLFSSDQVLGWPRHYETGSPHGLDSFGAGSRHLAVGLACIWRHGRIGRRYDTGRGRNRFDPICPRPRRAFGETDDRIARRSARPAPAANDPPFCPGIFRPLPKTRSI